MQDGSLTRYVNGVLSARVSLHKIPKVIITKQWTGWESLLVHVTQQNVLQTSKDPIPDWKVGTLPSEDGPFQLHQHHGWSTNKLIAAMEVMNTMEAPPYFIKLRGGERDELERRNSSGHGDSNKWLASCYFIGGSRASRGEP